METPLWSSEMNPTKPSQRQRSRKACNPCRTRKRKCDGRQPCGTCVRYEYDCFFNSKREPAAIKPSHGSSSSPTSGQTASPEDGHAHAAAAVVPSPVDTSGEDQTKSSAIFDPYKNRFMSTSSAVAFPRLLGIELSSSNAPRLHSFAWNLGIRPEPQIEQLDFTHYLSYAEAQQFVEVYFNVVHPVYDFIDQEYFTELLRARYDLGKGYSDSDAVICSIAALGSLFTIGTQQSSHPHEAELVNLARVHLQGISVVKSFSNCDITAWILRTIYLRATTRPHAAWISISTTMHLIEAAGLHQEISDIAIVWPATPQYSDGETDIRRRLFWVALSLNTVISYEYGRSRVRIPNTSVKMFDTRATTNTQVLIAFATQILRAEERQSNENEDSNVQPVLDALKVINTESEPLNLLKADIAFCLYRRLRCLHGTGVSIPAETTASIISIGVSALPYASSLASQRLPWWTVVSVPFQLLCVLLAVDSRESLSHVARAMEVLEDVGRSFNTHMTREAVGCASLLIKLSRRRKEDDLKSLSVPSRSGPKGPLDPEALAPISSMAQVPNLQNEARSASATQEVTMPPTINWADGLGDIEIPDDLNIDWSQYVMI